MTVSFNQDQSPTANLYKIHSRCILVMAEILGQVTTWTYLGVVIARDLRPAQNYSWPSSKLLP